MLRRVQTLLPPLRAVASHPPSLAGAGHDGGGRARLDRAGHGRSRTRHVSSVVRVAGEGHVVVAAHERLVVRDCVAGSRRGIRTRGSLQASFPRAAGLACRVVAAGRYLCMGGDEVGAASRWHRRRHSRPAHRRRSRIAPWMGLLPAAGDRSSRRHCQDLLVAASARSLGRRSAAGELGAVRAARAGRREPAFSNCHGDVRSAYFWALAVSWFALVNSAAAGGGARPIHPTAPRSPGSQG